MAAATPKSAQGDICPDPSAHNPGNAKLQDQASRAALYVTHPGDKGQGGSRNIQALGPDGKLSSAGAAASLKHAQPHELPSFPSVGIDSRSSGSQAATLAQQNQKPFEHWKPGLSSSAGRAALLAHKDGGKLDLWQPSSSETGHTAAGLAMGKQQGLSPQIDYGHTDDGRKKALLAATKSTSGRGRSGSTPSQPTTKRSYPDAEHSAYNALNAATVANKPSARPTSMYSSQGPEESAQVAQAKSMVHNISSEVPTSDTPGVADTKDKDHQAALRASTVSMSKQLVEAQEARVQGVWNPPGDLRQQAKNYLHLQEAAQRLASERLEKLDPDGVLAYREHYGYQGPQASTRRKLSVRNRRKSEGHEPANEDQERAGRIRHQMSRFNEKLADVDNDKEKRAKDRNSLMAAAEKAVHQRMSVMDKQVFEETGKITPAMMEEWEAKARAKAASNSEKRLEKHGLVNVGGGKYMRDDEVEAIAQGRMQPTLDEIADNAEKQRARDEEIRLDQEERKRQAAVEKERARETKAQLKATTKQEKEEEKQRRAEGKEQEKVMRRLEKEESRQMKEAKKDKEAEQRHSKDTAESEVSRSEEEPHITATTEMIVTNESESAAKPSEGHGHQPETAAEKAAAKTTAEDPPGVPTQFHPDATSPKLNDDSAPPQPSTTAAAEAEPPSNTKLEDASHAERDKKRRSRLSGIFGKFKRSSRSAPAEGQSKSTPSSDLKQPAGDKAAPSSIVSASHEPSEQPAKIDKGKGKARSPSPSLSDMSNEPDTGGVRESVQSGNEEFEEAKDTFEEGVPKKMDLPFIGKTVKREGSRSPARSSGSKFKEEV